ncbi:MAG: hypothetical protein WD119_02530, partial [Pirellulaceae bacterium]
MSQSPSPSGSPGDRHPADDASPPPVRASSGKSSFDTLLESRLAVLCILFFVTGALGLPLLWFSPRFSWPQRIFWGVVVTIYTILLIALVAMVLRWSYNQI